MAEVTQEFMYELMKRMHERFDKLENKVSDLQAEFIGLRGVVASQQSDIHNIYGILHRQDDRMERIEKRLDLREFSEGGSPYNPEA